ncbi:MAG: serine/threonine-protein kinase, partial [Gemmataceae bacterium]
MIDTCPDDETLRATLRSADPELTEHLDGCARCRHRREELARTSVIPDTAADVTGRIETGGCPEPAVLENLPVDSPWATHVAACSLCQQRRENRQQDAATLSAVIVPVRSPPPQVIGKYQIVETLGRGGQAVVFRAVHPTLGKDVVIKLGLKAAETGQTSLLVTEGKLLARLNHANLVRVHDLDFHEGKPFLVMEYVRGGSLDVVARRSRPAPREAARLVAHVARAVATAHRVGIVHLDIKPANVLIDDHGTPLLADFGMARFCTVLDDDRQKSIGGTPRYMAPEQARGETDRIGPHSDIYALGGILYFLLSGHDPRGGSTLLEIMDKAGRGEMDWSPLEKSGAPRRLQAACRRALALKPEERYPSADAFAVELERFVHWHGRRRFLVAALAGAGLAAGTTYALWPAPPAEWPVETQLLISDVERGGKHIGQL